MIGAIPVHADRGGGGGSAFPPPGEPPDRTTTHEPGDRPESAVEDGNLPGDAARSQHCSETPAAEGSPVTATETGLTETGDVEAGINALWRQFAEAPEQRLRDRLVLHYAPLVKYVAGRVGTGLPTHVDVGDLVQSGIFGLVDAIEKFEPERGLRFETYAMQRIRGAILDDLRSQDWVPRVVRSRAREAERAMERLGARLNRTPTDAELATELEITVDELRDLYGQLQLTSVVALEDLVAVGKDSGSLVDTLPDDDAVDPVAVLVDQDNRRQLADAIAQLSERDRIVVSLYYFESLTLAEIGKVLGVTESRVSQLHTRAVLRLRAKLVEQAGV
ncbi:FliA/WhiG family RNA polymerase sigma factor [Amycolatopsis albispora]|uniref:FliA/WhiG family RNA polymerase sigma factor n=1 Tax=Amycolatopsis albispora TaxID=1804986 RepID=UPI003AAF24BD